MTNERKGPVGRVMQALVDSITGADVKVTPYDFYNSPARDSKGIVDLPDGTHAAFTHAAPHGQRPLLNLPDSRLVGVAPLAKSHRFGG